MNKFFLEKVKKLRAGIPLTDTDPLARMRDSLATRSCSFSFKPVTAQQMTKIVSGLRSSKATGVDYMDVASMKLVAKDIAPWNTRKKNQ